MIVHMKNLERLSTAELKSFLANQEAVHYAAAEKQGAYSVIESMLKAQHYRRLKKGQKGIVRRFLVKITGLSRAQITRLIQRFLTTRRVVRKPARQPSFHTRYTPAGIALLADIDEAHQELSGPAVRRLLQREFQVYGNPEFARLNGISASHIYNLRKSQTYGKIRVRFEHTQARPVSIGERRQPNPLGRPGYLRVDTVHQGHHDDQPGVYHINAVDTVTQWQVVGCVKTICERDLIPVLEAMLHQFPFRILGFHCDNGAEFLNHNVVKLLNKLLVEEFTKSRAYRSTDNALVEGKNGAVVRKHIGYGAIGAEHAEAFQKFYTAQFNPYLTFHRPCGFATIRTDRRGKRKRVYRHQDYRTLYEKLATLKRWTQYLKEGVTQQHLQQQAQKQTDTQAARAMQKAKLALLARCRRKLGVSGDSPFTGPAARPAHEACRQGRGRAPTPRRWQRSLPAQARRICAESSACRSISDGRSARRTS
jgi:hypothetical protein